jgi:SP family general alpha glucoside:H+ symporter-like MFS transporter
MASASASASASPSAGGHGYSPDAIENAAPLRFPRRDQLEPSESMDKLVENARAATRKEHEMTLWQGIRLYPKAVFWSLLISTCIAMEGYDISLVNNFYAFPVFNRKYGERLADGTYQVPARVCQSIKKKKKKANR